MNSKKSLLTGRDRFFVLFSYFILCTWSVYGHGTELHEAVKLRDAQRVQELIDTSIFDVNEKNEFGEAALHTAAKIGDADIVSSLLSAGADVNIKHRIGNITPLHLAAKEGRLETVLVLLDGDADVNATIDTLVLRFFMKFKTFMDDEAEMVTDNSADHTPAYWAFAYGHMDIVEVLEEAGAQPISPEENVEIASIIWDKVIELFPAAHADGLF